MEILFKDDEYVYYIDDNNVLDRSTHAFMMLFYNTNLDNIPHLNNAKVLYHYRHGNGDYLPVYYEHGNSSIAGYSGEYLMLFELKRYTKDYTLVNLNLLEDGNII